MTDLYGKMSEARSLLGRALLECQTAHDRRPWVHTNTSGCLGGCICDGCRIRKSIEAAIAALEV